MLFQQIYPGVVDTGFFENLSIEPGQNPTEHLHAKDVASLIPKILVQREGCVIDEINLSPLKKVIQKKLAKSL